MAEVQAYAHERSKAMARLQEAIATQDRAAVAHEAHRWRPAAQSAREFALAAVLLDLETWARSGSDPARLAHLEARLRALA